MELKKVSGLICHIQYFRILFMAGLCFTVTALISFESLLVMPINVLSFPAEKTLLALVMVYSMAFITLYTSFSWVELIP